MSTVATTTMESRIKKFLKEKDLDEDLCEDFVNLTKDLFGDLFKHLVGEKIPSVSKKSSEKKAKLEIDDLVEGIELSDLKGTSCTSAVLDDYIKKNSLRTSGTKSEKAERVFRHLEGNSLPEDGSPRNKPKEPKAKKIVHDCCGRTGKGTACATAATEEFNGHWFCWRHFDTKEEILEASKKKAAKKVVESDEEMEEEPVVVKPKKKVAKKVVESDDEE